eukprot:gb/GEZN01010038.1/.p1 GENE.gb/GEZN01010038.1/~~gb/GEZN01010038.1/.p1  ORF type:complete len:260 (+),score=36.39 gb/GEZN01010038.1/:175-954(+)
MLARMQKAWSQGRAAVCSWQVYAQPLVTELFAHSGFDGLVVDMQHGIIDYQDCVSMLTAVRSSPSPPTALVRVPQGIDEGLIAKVLDAGAMAIICPMVNTAAEARHFIACCQYPPKGIRSFGPTVPSGRKHTDYWLSANERVLKIAMIETKQALDNLEEICSSPGLDGLFIGPSDLAISLGRQPSGEPTDTQVLAAIRKIVTTGQRHKLKVGMWAAGSGHYAGKIVKAEKLDWVVSCFDQGLLLSGTEQNLRTFAQSKL